MLLAGIATLLVTRNRTPRNELTVSASAKPASTADSRELNVVEESTPDETVSANPIHEATAATEVEPSISLVVPTKNSPTDSTEVGSPTETPAEPKTASAEVPLVFKDLQQRQFQLSLPSIGLARESTAVKLAALPVPPNEPVELSLLSAPESGLKMTPTESGKDEGLSWTVIKAVRGGVKGTEEVILGQFTVQAGELRFQWSSTAAEWCKPGSLQFAILAIQVGADRQECRLWKPVELNPARLTAKDVKSANQISIPHVAELVDRPEAVQWEATLTGLPDKITFSPPTKIGEPIVLVVGDDFQSSVEVELEMTLDNQCRLQARLFSRFPALVKGGQTNYERIEINRPRVAAKRQQAKASEQRKLEFTKKQITKDISDRQNRLKVIETLINNVNANRLLNASDKVTQAREFSNEERIQKQTIAEQQVRLQGIDTELTTIAAFQAERSNWCDAVLKILDTLEDRAELRYAVRIQAQRLIPIVMTSGFEEPKKSR